MRYRFIMIEQEDGGEKWLLQVPFLWLFWKTVAVTDTFKEAFLSAKEYVYEAKHLGG